MMKLFLYKAFMLWVSFLGNEDWETRELAEKNLKELNNTYDFRIEIKELTKSKDLEIRTRAKRIDRHYFPVVSEWPMFHTYNGVDDTKWQILFNDNFSIYYKYDEMCYKQVWQCKSSNKELRSTTCELVKYWIENGDTLDEVYAKLKVMWNNERKGIFFFPELNETIPIWKKLLWSL